MAAEMTAHEAQMEAIDLERQELHQAVAGLDARLGALGNFLSLLFVACGVCVCARVYCVCVCVCVVLCGMCARVVLCGMCARCVALD